jgi:hypothetical protein
MMPDAGVIEDQRRDFLVLSERWRRNYRPAARSNSSRVTPKCFIQYLISFELVTVILLRSGIALLVRLRRTDFSIVRIQLAAFQDGE